MCKTNMDKKEKEKRKITYCKPKEILIRKEKGLGAGEGVYKELVLRKLAEIHPISRPLSSGPPFSVTGCDTYCSGLVSQSLGARVCHPDSSHPRHPHGYSDSQPMHGNTLATQSHSISQAS